MRVLFLDQEHVVVSEVAGTADRVSAVLSSISQQSSSFPSEFVEPVADLESGNLYHPDREYYGDAAHIDEEPVEDSYMDWSPNSNEFD